MKTLLLVVALLLFSLRARADGTASFVEAGPVSLDASGAGRVTLRNSGPGPLHVTSLYARSSERDPRLPGTLNVTFEGGSTKADLAPGESRPISLKWDRQGARMTQLLGHVVVESTDAAAPQRAIGVVAQPPSALGFLTHHVGTWLVLLPFLGALALVPFRLSRRLDDKLARYVALGTVGLMGALAVWALRNFDALATRADGNDGLQLVERARLFGAVEWFLAFDGVSLPLLLVALALAAVGVLASFPVARDHERFFAAYLVALGAVVGALLAEDAMLLVGFLALFALSFAALVARFSPRVAVHALLTHALAIAILVVVVLALRRASEPTFLIDGTRAQSFALPELARGEWLDRTHGGLTLFGRPFVQAAFVAVFVASALLLSALPLHGALGAVFAAVPASASILLVTAGSTVGSTLLLRLGVNTLPEGLRWAAPALAALGAAGVVWGALAALGESDLRRVAAHAAVAHAGVVLLGITACTPQGVAGAIVHTAARAAVVSMLLLVAGALHDRVGVAEIGRFGGLGRETPRLGALATIAFLASVALPGTLPFASAWLSVGGSLPAHRAQTALAVLGLALLGVALLRVHARVVLGELDEAWRKAPSLEPFGGRFPDLDARELSTLAALAALTIGLGLAPSVIVELSRGAVADLDVRVNAERIAASIWALVGPRC